ncbi:substrate-binding domain-containing protein [Polynucleobacter sp. VK25]|uniref:molybdate ABC transporter substrate-binding protein n=1 Tax=Polynucleobacter sp. VK25 TaxID=1758398 RepID=UPI001BFD75FB|nr:substrate-binding domain-containing protein [Polynucleobacter sp. VK25]QWD68697.1 substrate-binding domain-containing protein [Polynucleobacter sp. VK25]
MLARALVGLLCLGSLVCSYGAHAAEYRFYSAAGAKVPLNELSQLFNRTQSDSKIVNYFDTAGAAEKQFLEDPKSSCLVTTQVRINGAIKSGALKSQEQISLADTLAGLASSSAAKPKIGNTQELRNALLNAKSIAFSDPARGATVGKHFEEMIKKLGIEKEVMAKAMLASDGVETMKLVMAKKVELGVTQMSEVIQADRSTLVGPFPPEFELATRYSLWCKDPSSPEISSYIALLKSRFGAQVFSYNGLRPVQ